MVTSGPKSLLREVEKNIKLDMYGDDELKNNVDAYSSIADRDARHGSLLFDEMGIQAALAHIRQFESDYSIDT